jgi:hypothetical protein
MIMITTTTIIIIIMIIIILKTIIRSGQDESPRRPKAATALAEGLN